MNTIPDQDIEILITPLITLAKLGDWEIKTYVSDALDLNTHRMEPSYEYDGFKESLHFKITINITQNHFHSCKAYMLDRHKATTILDLYCNDKQNFNTLVTRFMEAI